MDKGAVITLDEGGEGFATPKHLVKEDGTQAQLGEELPFKVIEFVKDTKRTLGDLDALAELKAKMEKGE